jgi:hypothetical protein
MPEWCQATYAAYSQFPVREGMSLVPTGKADLASKLTHIFAYLKLMFFEVIIFFLLCQICVKWRRIRKTNNIICLQNLENAAKYGTSYLETPIWHKHCTERITQQDKINAKAG